MDKLMYWYWFSYYLRPPIIVLLLSDLLESGSVLLVPPYAGAEEATQKWGRGRGQTNSRMDYTINQSSKNM